MFTHNARLIYSIHVAQFCWEALMNVSWAHLSAVANADVLWLVKAKKMTQHMKLWQTPYPT